MSLKQIILIPLGVVFGGLGLIFAVAGEGKALLGLAMTAVLVGAPILAALLVAQGVRQSRQQRAERQAYEAGLIARFDAETRADPVDIENLDPPDAEQMRRQAWQPDGLSAVRPANPAPWHVVTQFPTSQFQAPTEPRD